MGPTVVCASVTGQARRIVASSRGGVYATSERGRAMEHQESYLQIVFGFMGITDLRFVRAEGLAMGEAHKAQALAAAELEIKALLAVPANQPRVALTARGERATSSAAPKAASSTGWHRRRVSGRPGSAC